MASKLEKLLQDIDPSRTIDVVEKRINHALANYRREKNTVDSWEEYQEYLAKFVRLARNAAFDLPADAGQSLEFDFKNAIQYLEEEYPRSTSRTVYDIMSTGAEGGVLGLSRTLAGLMAEDFSQNEIRGRVSTYWQSLSVDEKLASADEYIKKYKDILPRKTTQDVVSIKANFVKVLNNHPRMIKRLRDLKR
jgi:hypothetical protein